MKRPLPKPHELLEAQAWLGAGCPLRPDAERALQTLLALIDALPSHMPQYCYGTPEWKAAGGWGRNDEEDA